jgi:regulator of protease activity HflC (stomatin/prohibitin superfamily)
MTNEELHKENEEVYRTAIAAKRWLQETIISEGQLDHAELYRQREIFFKGMARHHEITAHFEAERQADIARRQAKRDARRAEAANWSKRELMDRTGLSRKDLTRAQLIDSYASMAG